MKNRQILTLVLLSTVFVFSDSLAKSCGPSCEYTIDDDGNVVISGTGAITGLEAGDKNKVTNVTINSGIESIGDNAFRMNSLTSVTIPDSVTSIGYEAFGHISGLKDVTIPSSVTSIGAGAFTGVSTAEIQGQNVSIGKDAFYYAQNVSHNGVTYSCGTDCVATVDKDGNAVYTGNGTLSNGAIRGFKIITAEINDGITDIGTWAFRQSSLTSVSIPDTVTSVGDEAFGYISGLKDVTIPASVTSIGAGAFNTASNVEIQGENVSIGNEAFYYTKNISHNGVSAPCGTDCVVTIDKDGNAVYSGSGTLSNGAIRGFKIITAEINEGITDIATWAFRLSSLTSVTIPDSVTSIGDEAFGYISGLKSMNIKGQNVNMAERAFGDSGIRSGQITYTAGGLTEQYILGKFPNATLKRVLGPHKYWTMEELNEVLRDDKTNSVSLTW